MRTSPIMTNGCPDLVQKVCENEAELDAEVETVLKAINIARPQAVARCKKMLQQVRHVITHVIQCAGQELAVAREEDSSVKCCHWL